MRSSVIASRAGVALCRKETDAIRGLVSEVESAAGASFKMFRCLQGRGQQPWEDNLSFRTASYLIAAALCVIHLFPGAGCPLSQRAPSTMHPEESLAVITRR